MTNLATRDLPTYRVFTFEGIVVIVSGETLNTTTDDSWIPAWISWGAKALRFIHAHKLVWHARDTAIVTVLRTFHFDVVHQVRCLALATSLDRTSEASLIASNLCTKIHDAMATLLELSPNELHCCIKLIAPKTTADETDRIGTWVRSSPADGRPIELKPEDDFHAINKNTVWSAFYGVSDGSTIWQKTNCFACNDLTMQGDVFRCDREIWSRYYRSTLVFPINRSKNADGSDVERLGFLAFDSPKTGAFRGLPDIFAFREAEHEYRDRLHRSSAFHLGAICADLLGTSLAFGVKAQPALGLETEFKLINNGGEIDDGKQREPKRLVGPDQQSE